VPQFDELLTCCDGRGVQQESQETDVRAFLEPYAELLERFVVGRVRIAW
jgi:hypothetical protein